TARPAAEIVGTDEDLGIAVRRLVQHKIRVLRSVLTKPDFLEQPVRQAGPLDRLQIDRRKDLVGIEIDDRQWRRNASHLSEFFHGDPFRYTAASRRGDRFLGFVDRGPGRDRESMANPLVQTSLK